MAKILVVAPTPFFSDRGTHIRILEEALVLEKMGHQLTIATYHIGREIDPDLQSKIDVRRIRRLLFWYKKLEAGPDWQKLLLDIMLIRKAFNLARKLRPDIIHAHLHEGVMLGWIVQKALFWRKIKLVADFHGSLTREMISHSYLSGGILKKIFAHLEKFINNLGEFAITSSPENTEDILKTRRDKKIETVFDGVNLENYQKLPEKTASKKELELPLDKIIISYTGALVFNKGVRNLFEAMPLVLNSTQDAYFVIAGFPIGEAEKFVTEHDLKTNVRLISPLNYFELPALLNASDIGVDPKDSSTRQASGKILPYMAAGLPVLCFDRVNNRAYLGEGAFYAAKNNGVGLAEKILAILQNKQEISEKGALNKKRAERFSWDISAKKIDEIYQKIL